MLNKVVSIYARAYPDLGARLHEFFHVSNASIPNGWQHKRIVDFLETLPKVTGIEYPQPHIIDEMCKALCRVGVLTHIGLDARMSIAGLGNQYQSGGEIHTDPIRKKFIGQLYNCIIFGFPWIYHELGRSVLPVAHTDAVSGLASLGTSFVNGTTSLLTAAHCVSDAGILAIRDVPPDTMARAKFYVSRSEAIDLALIHFDQAMFADKPTIHAEEPRILDEVIALGYPNVSGFIPSLAGEKAIVSSRLTAVRGTVASTPVEIWAREALLLITARVRGGFSGGPVINEKGQYVGIVSRGPHNEAVDDPMSAAHQYDNLGYGTVIPESMIRAFLKDIESGALLLAKELDTGAIKFQEFE